MSRNYLQPHLIWFLLFFLSAIDLQASERLLSSTRLASKGEFCEWLALNQLLQQYSAREYAVLTNVEYKFGHRAKVRGELDLLVVKLHQKTRGISEVGEVKCQHREASALEKATKQLQRFKKDFLKHCFNQGREPLVLILDDQQAFIAPCDNIEDIRFHTYGPDDQTGFDQPLGYCMADIDDLYQSLAREATRDD